MSQEEKTPQEEVTKKDAGKVFLEEVTSGPSGHQPRWRRIVQSLTVPVLAIFTGLLIGGLIIVLTTEEFYTALQVSLWDGLKAGWDILIGSYAALFTGAFGDPTKIREALQSGDPEAIRRAFAPFFESLVASTPYIFGGLAVALGADL